jgi:hypothetical protein
MLARQGTLVREVVEPEAVTRPLRALQIGGATKIARPVTDKDLMGFVLSRVPEGTPTIQANLPYFKGIQAEYVRDGIFWREWWLRSANTTLYVTYNTREMHEHAEVEIVDSIVRTLKPLATD